MLNSTWDLDDADKTFPLYIASSSITLYVSFTTWNDSTNPIGPAQRVRVYRQEVSLLGASSKWIKVAELVGPGKHLTEGGRIVLAGDKSEPNHIITAWRDGYGQLPFTGYSNDESNQPRHHHWSSGEGDVSIYW